MVFLEKHHEDYSLNRQTFSQSANDMRSLLRLGSDVDPYDVDMFSLPDSARLPRYWTPDDDAFAQDWASIVGWVHPPYSMGKRVLDKILATSCFTGAVCLPDWPSQAWYTQFHNICTTFRT